MLVDAACTTWLGRLFQVSKTLLVKKNLCRSYLLRLFCNLKSFLVVANIVAIVKFGTASISYLLVCSPLHFFFLLTESSTGALQWSSWDLIALNFYIATDIWCRTFESVINDFVNLNDLRRRVFGVQHKAKSRAGLNPRKLILYSWALNNLVRRFI